MLAVGAGSCLAQQHVSRHDIAGIWVAFFQECQRYRCGQGTDLAYYKDAESAVHKQKARGRLSLHSFAVHATIPEAEQSHGMLKATTGQIKHGMHALDPLHHHHHEFGFMLSDGTLSFKLAAETEEGREEWVRQLTLVTELVWRDGATGGLPGALACRGGPIPVTLAEFQEASRDFTRTFVATGKGSGNLLLMGRSQLAGEAGGDGPAMEAVVCQTRTGGDLTEQVTSDAATEFEGVVAKLLSSQLGAPDSAALSAAETTAVTRRVIGHLTVTPSMELLVSRAIIAGIWVVFFQRVPAIIVRTGGQRRLPVDVPATLRAARWWQRRRCHQIAGRQFGAVRSGAPGFDNRLHWRAGGR